MLEILGGVVQHIQGWLDPRALAAGGYLVIAIVVCIETGVAVGVVMPGESLVLLAGMLAASGHLNIAILIPLLFVAAVVGDAMGFAAGKHLGPRLFARKSSFFFRPEYLERAQAFYDKYGGKTIVLARFVPVVRTFAPIVAGAARMQYRRFFLFNVVGAFFWVSSMLLTGYFLGRAIPDLENKLGWAILLVIAVSLLVPGADYVRMRLMRKRAAVEPESAPPAHQPEIPRAPAITPRSPQA